MTKVKQKTEQEWVFGILRQGMRDKHCYELCARRGVLHVVLSFFSSPLCDDTARVGGPLPCLPSWVPVHIWGHARGQGL